MVVLDILGVVKLVPEAKLTPPVDAAYQLIVPELVVAPKVIVPASQREAGVVPAILGEVKTFIALVTLAAAQPPVVGMVYVITVDPAATAVTTPVEAFTVAIVVVVEDHEPPSKLDVKVVVVPEQTDVFPLITPADGEVVIVNVFVAVLAGHPSTPACV